ncbi:MAG TPA: aminodeoxychorismate/anthranilate synthase component II [Acidimicrobiales bacterium]|nr:aminodeoxychorismate/anthranilate synthase component II [Acidimicrobiales bacterium]
MGARVLLVDNYDSFTYNLVQEMGALGAEPVVHRNDAIGVDGIRELDPDGIVISPGPGRPEDGGVSMAVISELGGDTPILGVCLGHQCIGQVFGARIVSAPELMHGKTSAIFHTGVGVFAEMPNPFDATRYHSLIVDRDSIPDVLEITAETTDGIVMGLRHREMAIEGVQFHPESILTSVGPDLLTNFLGSLGATRT